MLNQERMQQLIDEAHAAADQGISTFAVINDGDGTQVITAYQQSDEAFIDLMSSISAGTYYLLKNMNEGFINDEIIEKYAKTLKKTMRMEHKQDRKAGNV